MLMSRQGESVRLLKVVPDTKLPRAVSNETE